MNEQHDSPLRWGQSVAAHGTGPTATVDIDVQLPGADEPVPMEIPLADAKVLHSMLGDVIRDIEAPDGIADLRRLACSWWALNRPHDAHAWQPQPGMRAVWCCGRA